MKNTDKLLVAIVLGVVILVGVAFAVAFMQPKPAYESDETPAGVTHNYLLAIQQKDYERAYGYLSLSIPGRPYTVDRFIQNIKNYSYFFASETKTVSLEVISSDINGNDAIVSVRQTIFNNGGLFDSGESTRTFHVDLRLNPQKAEWKITSSELYWATCWNRSGGCK